MAAPAVRFQPFVQVMGVYDTGLSAVRTVNAAGELANASSYGVSLGWGISGMRSWKRTKVGLNYRGDLTHYNQQTDYDGSNQELSLGITHVLSRHAMLSLRTSAGTFSRGSGQVGLTQTVPFDPATTYVPRTDFFDNRTLYLTTQADVTLQKTARLSFNFGGAGSIVSRRSNALYGVTVGGATGDIQYRATAKTTLGAAYSFYHYDYTRVFGGTVVHSMVGTYAIRLSRWLELSMYGGVMRIESQFIQAVPVDPIIASLLGITAAPVLFHKIDYQPSVSGRLSRTFRSGVLYGGGGRTAVPGNGLFLTSTTTSAMVGYGYTGLRRWSFNASMIYLASLASANVSGHYTDATGTVGFSRKLTGSIHMVGAFYGHRYSSGDFARYNRMIYETRIGIGFTPGSIPLRIW
jgi:hypothetical protein